MFNMEEDQTLVQTSLMDTDKDDLTITPVDTRGNLNLQEVKMVLLHFALFSENRWE